LALLGLDARQSFLAIVDSETEDLPYALSLVSIATGERRRLTFPDGSQGYGDSGLAFSPDGRTLVFVRSTGHYAWDLFALRLAEDYGPQGAPRRLTFDNQPYLSGPAWVAGGREIVFGNVRRGLWLWRMDPFGGAPPRTISIPHTRASNLAVSPRGDRLIYLTETFDTDIWKADLRERGGKAETPTSLIVSSYIDWDPQFPRPAERPFR
jgi:Tol biopolymer transport system component